MSEAAIKRATRERAGMKCSACDTTNEQNIATWGESLHVHRVMPGSEYTLDGVVVYCTRCHCVVGHGGSEPKRPSEPPKPPQGNTKARSFRLDEETIAWLDEIASHHTATTGVEHSRSDAIRIATQRGMAAIRKKRGSP